MTTPTTTTSCCCDNGFLLLPQDAVFEILSWLPVKSLLRFKSVCKSWYALINSSAFIHRHHHHQNNHNLLVMHASYPFTDSDHPYLSSSTSTQGGLNFTLLPYADNFEVSKQLDLPGLSKVTFYPSNAVHMITSNGIVCVYNEGECCYLNDFHVYNIDVFMWNPATKESTALPQSPLILPCYESIPSISLGFSFTKDDQYYQVVRILIFNDTKCRYDIYSSSTDSWRTTLDVKLPDDIISITSDPKEPYKTGTYCWFGMAKDGDYRLSNYYVLSFDFSTEVFGTTPLPDTYNVKSDPCSQFEILRGNIACINRVDCLSFQPDNQSMLFEVWMLNEYGVKESWTKLYTVGPFLQCIPVGLALLKKNGECFLFDGETSLCFYNLATQEIKRLPVQGNRGCWGAIPVARYKESLVSLKRRNGTLRCYSPYLDDFGHLLMKMTD